MPHVRGRVEELKEGLLKEMSHTRILPISAARGENTRELMQRVRKLLDKIDGLVRVKVREGG